MGHSTAGNWLSQSQPPPTCRWGGVWESWAISSAPRPLDTLRVPKLIAWGTRTQDLVEVHANASGYWDALIEPKYGLILRDGAHWDYVPAPDTDCDGLEGPCHLVADIAADVGALFLSKYMPPEEFGTSFPGSIPDDLIVTSCDRMLHSPWCSSRAAAYQRLLNPSSIAQPTFLPRDLSLSRRSR
ncbi:hypothetical protein V1290_005264 [Bradyrhizobium sp. AZCC 1578]